MLVNRWLLIALLAELAYLRRLPNLLTYDLPLVVLIILDCL